MSERASQPSAGTALGHLRVLDLGTITAGAATGAVLADFGADVVKIESPSHPDPFRNWTQIAAAPGPSDPDRSPPFHTTNRGKRGLGLDLKHPAGRELFLRLVTRADLVIENFRRGVLDRLGLGYPVLRAARPELVLLSLSSQGSTGPESGTVSFGSTLDALGGLMSLTGYAEDTPTWSGNNVNFPDQLVSFLAPGVALAALRTGRGCWVDLSQREAVTAVLGEQLAAASLSGTAGVPTGNRAASSLLRGAYRCSGPDSWLAVDATTPAHLAALDTLLSPAGRGILSAGSRDPVGPDRTGHPAGHGAPDGEPDPASASATRSGPAAAAAVAPRELEARLVRWAADLDNAAAAGRLRAAGVPASAVREAPEVLADPALAGFFQRVDTPMGPLVQRGFVGELSGTPGRVRRGGPGIGEHTGEILRDWLELADAEIDALVATGALVARPVTEGSAA